MDLSDLATPEPDVEYLLRRHFAERGSAAAAAPTDLAATTRVRHRRRRQQQVALAGTALAVALIAGGIPMLRAALPAPHHIAATSSPAANPPAGDLYDQPTRGTVAGDDGWLAALAARAWAVDPQAGRPVPPPATHRVVFASDVPGGRIALVLGRSGGKTAYLWFHGTKGADPGQMTEAAAPQLTGAGQPLALLDVIAGGGKGAVLVVVGEPGDSAEYVSGSVAGTGHPIDLDMTDGVAVTEVTAPIDQAGAGQVQVARNGQAPMVVVPDASGVAAPTATPTLSIEDPRGLWSQVSQAQLLSLGRYMVGFYGLSSHQVEIVLLATGRIGSRQVVLLGGILPSGQTVAWQGSYPRTGPGAGTGNGTAPGPTTPLLTQTLALRTDGGVVVSGPLDGAAAEVLDSNGAVLGTVPLVNGAGAGAVPGAPARVRITGQGGAVLAETTVGTTR